MSLPRKFKQLRDTELKDVEAPDYLWITYAVCATDADACGWGGWMIEAAFKATQEHFPTGTGDKLLSAMDEQVCPRCGRELFRTAASIRFEPSADQTPVHGVPGVDYEISSEEDEEGNG